MHKNKHFIVIHFIIISVLITIGSLIVTASNQKQCLKLIPVINPIEIQRNLMIKFIDTYNPNLYKAQKIALCDTIISEAKYTGLNPFFISSVIAAESSFNPNAVSPCAAMGLMQLTTYVLEDLHITRPFDIQANIYGGTRFLKFLKGKFLNDSLVLAAYNAGPTLVSRLGRIPRIPETIEYVKKVTKLFHHLQQKMTTSITNSLVSVALLPMDVYISTYSQNQQPNQSISSKLLTPDKNLAIFDICESRNFPLLFFIS